MTRIAFGLGILFVMATVAGAQTSPAGTQCVAQVACPSLTVACSDGLPQPPQGTATCGAVATSCTLDTGIPWAAGAALNGAMSYTCTTSIDGVSATSCTGDLTASGPPPSVTVAGAPIALWPPDHRMQTVELKDCVSSAVDACTGQPIDVSKNGRIVRVTSDEPEIDPSDAEAQTCGDIQISGSTAVSLRRERTSGGHGRIYTIFFEIASDNGGTAAGSCQVGIASTATTPLPVAGPAAYCVGDGCPAQPACIARQ